MPTVIIIGFAPGLEFESCESDHRITIRDGVVSDFAVLAHLAYVSQPRMALGTTAASRPLQGSNRGCHISFWRSDFHRYVESLSLTSTVSHEPEPIPLDVKVVFALMS